MSTCVSSSPLMDETEVRVVEADMAEEFDSSEG